jgi:hypothetical protein
VVASAARHDPDVWAYLRDVLDRLATGGVDLAILLPDAWAKSHSEMVRVFRGHERESRAAAERARRNHRRLLAQAEAARQTTVSMGADPRGACPPFQQAP